MPQPNELTLLRKIEEVAEHVAGRSPGEWMFWIEAFIEHIADSEDNTLLDKEANRDRLWNMICDKLVQEGWVREL